MNLIRCTELDLHRSMALECETIPPEHGLTYVNRTVTKPWGWERQLFAIEGVSVWRLHLESDQETSLHCHQRKDAVFVLEKGELAIETLSGEWLLSAGDSTVIQRGAFHRLRAGSGGATLIEIEAPADKHDLKRLEDRYGRERQAYVSKERIA